MCAKTVGLRGARLFGGSGVHQKRSAAIIAGQERRSAALLQIREVQKAKILDFIAEAREEGTKFLTRNEFWRECAKKYKKDGFKPATVQIAVTQNHINIDNLVKKRPFTRRNA